MIRFQCPHCKTVLQTALSTAGAVVACGRCEARLRVPAAPRPAPPPPPPPPAAKKRSVLPLVLAASLFAVGGAAALAFVVPPFFKPARPGVQAKGDPPPEEKKVHPEPEGKSLPAPATKVAASPAEATSTELERALAALNDERIKSGAAPVRLDPDACKRATTHAEALLVRVDPTAFDEEKPAAAIAWKAPAAAVAGWLAGPLHRDLLLAQARETVGIGHARDDMGREVTVIDGLFGDQLAVGTASAILYPVPAQTYVPLLFPGNEVPDPLPDVKDKLAGYPITVQFSRRARVSAVEALLEDDHGKTVSAHVSSPEAPANKAFAAHQQNTVCLFAKQPLDPGRRYLVRVRARVDGGEWSRLWAFATQPRSEGTPRMFEAALRHLNAYRKAAGLPPVRADEALSRACQAHAGYLARHLGRVPDLRTHEEKESLEGYTKEGAAIAPLSAIRLAADGNPIAPVDQLMKSVVNRQFVLNPTLEKVGLGAAVQSPHGWIWVLHLPGVWRRKDGFPVLYPSPGQKDVPRLFARDLTEIVTDAPKDSRAGFPITVNFFPLVKVTDVKASLADADGNEVPCWLSTPEKRLPGTGTFQQIVLVPKAVLAPAATYRVKVSVTAEGTPTSRDWTFTTEDPVDNEGRVADQLLAQLNGHRKRAGLNPVTLDESLSRGCRLHAEYIARNIDHPKTQGLNIHDEDKALPGYTEAGHKAGKAAVIAVISEPGDSVDMWMGTLYHRLPLLDPALKRIGYGQRQHPIRGWITVLDSSGR